MATEPPPLKAGRWADTSALTQERWTEAVKVVAQLKRMTTCSYPPGYSTCTNPRYITVKGPADSQSDPDAVFCIVHRSQRCDPDYAHSDRRNTCDWCADQLRFELDIAYNSMKAVERMFEDYEARILYMRSQSDAALAKIAQLEERVALFTPPPSALDPFNP